MFIIILIVIASIVCVYLASKNNHKRLKNSNKSRNKCPYCGCEEFTIVNNKHEHKVDSMYTKICHKCLNTFT